MDCTELSIAGMYMDCTELLTHYQQEHFPTFLRRKFLRLGCRHCLFCATGSCRWFERYTSEWSGVIFVTMLSIGTSVCLHARSIDVTVGAAWHMNHVLEDFFTEFAICDVFAWQLGPHPFVDFAPPVRSIVVEGHQDIYAHGGTLSSRIRSRLNVNRKARKLVLSSQAQT